MLDRLLSYKMAWYLKCQHYLDYDSPSFLEDEEGCDGIRQS